MKKYIFLVLNIALASSSFAQAIVANDQKNSLYESSTEILMTEFQLRGMAGIVAFSKESLLGDSIFPTIKAEWEKTLAANFSQKEIKYLDDVVRSSLFKRYFKFQKDFASPANISRLINDKFKAMQVGTESKLPSPKGK